MAGRWFKRWCKPRDKKNHKVLGTEVLGVVATSLKVDTALRHNSKHAGSLYLLPEDLLFMICRHLTPAEIVTLMLTCTRFWRSRAGNGVFAKSWQQMASPLDKELSRVMARFYVMRMLEHDGLLQKGSPGKYCCWGCMKAHKRQAFSTEEFDKAVDLKSKQDSYPEEETSRSCASAKRYIWYGIYGEISFVELRHSIANQHKQPGKRRVKYSDTHDFTFPGYSSLDRNARRIESVFNIARTSDIRSYASFKRHARDLNLPLCPHLQLGDPGVVRAYLHPGKSYICRRCTTTFRIENVHFLQLQVFRYIGSLCSPEDPAWKAQSYWARHPRLDTHCREFCDWYVSLYGTYGHVTNGGRFRWFEPQRIDWLFEGVSTCRHEWPTGSRPCQLKLSKP